MAASKRLDSRRGATAFTLVELLVVIAIIAMLAAILMPTLSAVMRSGSVARAQAWVHELASGADTYALSHDNYYPGQDNPSAMGGNASSFLANALAGDQIVQFKPEDRDGNTGAILDRIHTNLKPILYFPSRKGQSGIGQYQYNDNSAVNTGGWPGNQTVFQNFIRDPRLGGNNPSNAGTFLLIGASTDDLQIRRYGTDYTLTNINR